MEQVSFLARGALGKRRTASWASPLVAILCHFLAGAIGILVLADTLGLREGMASGDVPQPSDDRFALFDAFAILIGMTIMIYVLIGLWLILWERRSFLSLGFEPGRFRQAGRGALIGLGAVALWVTGLVLTGAASPHLPVGEIDITGLVAALGLMPLAWMVQAGSEEVIYRGFLLQSIGSRFGPVIAIPAVTVVFSVMHFTGGTPDPWYFAGIASLSVFLCLYAIAENGLWGVAGFHAAWNYAQSNVAGLTAIDNQAPNALNSTLAGIPTPLRIVGPQAAISQGATLIALMLCGVAIAAILRKDRGMQSRKEERTAS